MRAVVYPKPNEITVRDNVPVRKPGLGEARVRIRSSTICGTDLKILSGAFPSIPFPHTPGHEWSGEVVDVGEGVTSVHAGDRVGNEPHVGCGSCRRCLEGLYNLCLNYGRPGHQHIGFTIPGGLAEYCTCSAKALHRLPSELAYDEGAFTESVGVALYAVERAGIVPGDYVAVVGPGAIGLIAVQIAKNAKGAAKVVLTGTREERLRLGRRLGADATVDVGETKDALTSARAAAGVEATGFDAVLEFAGSEGAAGDAIQLARRGGRISLSGATSPGKNLSVDLSLIVRGHLDIFGSLANPGVCERGLSLVARGLVDVKPLMSGDYKLEQFPEAVKAFKSRAGGAYRVMIHP